MSELSKSYTTQYSHFPMAPSIQNMKDFCDKVTSIARGVSGYASSHPCEFIAEVFSGLMMGVPYSQDILNAYAACGGPQLDAGMAHVRTCQNWFKKNILYPVSKPIFSIGD